MSESVRGADVYHQRVRTVAVKHRLVLETCGDVPAVGDVEVETCADTHADRPVLDVIGHDTYLREYAPPVGDLEYVVCVEVDVYGAVFFRQYIDRRLDAPVRIEAVAVVGADTDRGVVRVGVEIDTRTHRTAVIGGRAAVIAGLSRIVVVGLSRVAVVVCLSRIAVVVGLSVAVGVVLSGRCPSKQCRNRDEKNFFHNFQLNFMY